MNLRDSGVKDVRIALKPGSATIKKAEGSGFTVMTPADGAKWADIIMVLAPDELQGDIYTNDLGPNMKPGAALAFAHGLNVHFNLITPRKDIDVFMIAPKGPGHTVRSEYLRGGGVPCLVAVAQNSSGNALEIVIRTAGTVVLDGDHGAVVVAHGYDRARAGPLARVVEQIARKLEKIVAIGANRRSWIHAARDVQHAIAMQLAHRRDQRIADVAVRHPRAQVGQRPPAGTERSPRGPARSATLINHVWCD
jgi:hypothetical protein